MQAYHNFIGIDVGKYSFVVSLYGTKKTKEFSNDKPGIDSFVSAYRPQLVSGLSVLEATGGHEMRLLLELCSNGYAIHRANTRHVKNFIRSFSNGAKTDNLDARALSFYGYERHERLSCFTPQSKQALALYELAQRRHDLKKMIVAEKNRLQAPRVDVVKSSYDAVIKVLNAQVKDIADEIERFILEDERLRRKKAILKTNPGIGDIVANNLLVFMPELGTLNRREIASLAGVAPKSNDSGTFKGYRATSPGREQI